MGLPWRNSPHDASSIAANFWHSVFEGADRRRQSGIWPECPGAAGLTGNRPRRRGYRSKLPPLESLAAANRRQQRQRPRAAVPIARRPDHRSHSGSAGRAADMGLALSVAHRMARRFNSSMRGRTSRIRSRAFLSPGPCRCIGSLIARSSIVSARLPIPARATGVKTLKYRWLPAVAFRNVGHDIGVIGFIARVE